MLDLADPQGRQRGEVSVDVRIKSVRELEVAGRRVLVRVDFNVPLEGKVVTDDTRMRAAPDAALLLRQARARSRHLMSHLGRPKGGPDPKYTWSPRLTSSRS
jgi:phosphoglycerate kinase